MLKSGHSHWGSAAKFFHWTIVLLLLAQGTIGLIMVDLPKRPNVFPIYNFHKSLGLTILTLAVLRLLWRALDPRPAEPADIPRWQALGARAGHALLYGLLFLLPLSGWWFDSVSALRPLYWFGLIPVPPLGGPDPMQPELKDFARNCHEFLFWTLVVVAAGHATMALIHQFIHRNNVLGRMWPAKLQRRSKSPKEVPHVAAQTAPAADPTAFADTDPDPRNRT